PERCHEWMRRDRRSWRAPPGHASESWGRPPPPRGAPARPPRGHRPPPPRPARPPRARATQSLRRAAARGRAPAAPPPAAAARPASGALAAATAARDWSRVRVYFADERAVAPDDPASNFRLARASLLDRVAVPPRQVHRMKGDYADLEAAVEEYEAHLREPM